MSSKFLNLKKMSILLFMFIIAIVFAGNFISVYAVEGSEQASISKEVNVINQTTHSGIDTSTIITCFIAVTLIMIGILLKQSVPPSAS